jgi:hypothetical protein
MVNVRNVTKGPTNVTLAGLNASLRLGGRRGVAWTRPAGATRRQAGRSAVAPNLLIEITARRLDMALS